MDLEYNLPVQVRDQALGLTNDDEPQSDVGKEFQLHQRVKEGETESSFSDTKPSDLLLRLQRTTPYYKVGLQTKSQGLLSSWLLADTAGKH